MKTLFIINTVIDCLASPSHRLLLPVIIMKLFIYFAVNDNNDDNFKPF